MRVVQEHRKESKGYNVFEIKYVSHMFPLQKHYIMQCRSELQQQNYPA